MCPMCDRDTYPDPDDADGLPLCEGCNNVAEDACTCDPL
jgi:hypothetical protein